jgi:unsaturated chondroitin disaccharide hydrolase
MKTYFTVAFLLIASVSNSQKIDVQKVVQKAAIQTKLLLQETGKADKGAKHDLVSPRSVDSGKLKLVRSSDWTSGFFPGVLWYLYDFSKDKKWLNDATRYTSLLQKEQFNAGTHDLGFMMNCSFGNGYRLTHNEAYKKVLVQSAKSLSKRFNATAGTIRSWDHHQDQWDYPVIIDNMMNLELLFDATRFSGDSSFYKVAVIHANTTLKNHFRPDYSSFHVVDYDVATGAVVNRQTHQGYSDASAWARGQAWALYGFTICYRETKDPAYLKQAEGIASFILNNKNMPSDLVPYWDYNDPKIPNVPRDASAAAITASALYELITYSKKAKEYTNAATKMLNALANRYMSAPGTNKGFILAHSTGHKPAGTEIDAPITYADYYFLEALSRYQNMEKLRENSPKQTSISTAK